jgi:heat shock protein HslJ
MRRPLLGALAALAALTGVLVLLAGCANSGGAAPGGTGGEPSTAVIGSWRPVSIPGYAPPARFPDAFKDAPITFDSRHRLWGTDGCNGFDVSYRVARDGSISVGDGSSSSIGCANVPNAQVTTKARRVVVDGDELTLLDGDGRLLGRYQRIPAVGRPDVGPGPLATALVGTWRPLQIAGYRAPAEYADAMTYAAITFQSDGNWRASDGCNMAHGSYVLDSGGRISVTSGPTTLIGCANVPNAEVLSRAGRVQVVGDRMTLHSTTGAVLATYQRVP